MTLVPFFSEAEKGLRHSIENLGTSPNPGCPRRSTDEVVPLCRLGRTLMRSVADWKSLVCAGLLLAALGCDSGGSSNMTIPPAEAPDGTVVPSDGETPVEAFGQLRVEGTQIVTASGDPVQLKGPSSMWLNWEQDGYAESLDALVWMRDNWNLTVIRAAMGVEPGGAYLSNPEVAMAQVTTIIENAIDAGVYVIVDWHDHNAHVNQAAAEAFFA